MRRRGATRPDAGAILREIGGREPSGGDGRSAVALLLEVQRRLGHVPPEALDMAALRTGLPLAEVAGIASFFPRFRRSPGGLHLVRVCTGTACHVRGGAEVLRAFRRRLSVPPGEDVSPDGLFTVEEAPCLGCCALAPAVEAGGHVYGPVEPGGVDEILHDVLRSASSSPAPAAVPPIPGRGAAAPSGEVRLCRCTGCLSAGSGAVWDATAAALSSLRLPASLGEAGCGGDLWRAPSLRVLLPGGAAFRYGLVRPSDVAPLLLSHFAPPSLPGRLRGGLSRLLDGILSGEGGDGAGTDGGAVRFDRHVRPPSRETPEEGQLRIVTEGAGSVDPLDLAAYGAAGGFDALRRALLSLSPGGVADEVARSGLRGRGGAGFPTGEKWRAAAAVAAPARFVVCNGDEGDPGAFMDRMILESFPFRVLEGMALAGYGCGASRGFLFVRGEYGLALARSRRAVEILEGAGLLGDSVLGTSFSFRVEVVEGAGAYVCGEETALLRAVEGRRPVPSPRPPYPAEAGIDGLPTVVNNVETLALVPWIVRRGAAAFRAVGTAESPGTKVFALAGKVRRPGLVEVPMGTPLRTVVEGLGGGALPGRTLKAVQAGGPSGGCLPASLLDTPVDYGTLAASGTILGSGGLVVLDDTDCMVEVARYFADFARRESCGRCSFCRVGTAAIHGILEGLCRGEGGARAAAELRRWCAATAAGSLCGLGRLAPNPVLSVLDRFPGEVAAHAAGRCPARRCAALVSYEVGEGCIGCTRCAQACPHGAVDGAPRERHRVDDGACLRCGACLPACPTGAVRVVDRPRSAGGREGG